MEGKNKYFKTEQRIDDIKYNNGKLSSTITNKTKTYLQSVQTQIEH